MWMPSGYCHSRYICLLDDAEDSRVVIFIYHFHNSPLFTYGVGGKGVKSKLNSFVI